MTHHQSNSICSISPFRQELEGIWRWEHSQRIGAFLVQDAEELRFRECLVALRHWVVLVILLMSTLLQQFHGNPTYYCGVERVKASTLSELGRKSGNESIVVDAGKEFEDLWGSGQA